MTQDYTSFPIRTKETLKARRLIHFELPAARKKGDARVPLYPFLLTPRKSTLLVVRVSKRELCNATQQVRNKCGNTYLTHCDYYKVTNITYRVTELCWADECIKEISSHTTRDEADAALHKRHAES